MYLLGVVATIENTILWENVGGEVFDPGGVSSLSYCCIQGSFPGLGNIGLNPQFVDVDGIDNIPGTIDDDLHLLPTSPCFNSGNNGNRLLLCWDLDGNSRIVCGVVDMGAYEAPEPAAGCPPVFTRGDDNGDGAIDVSYDQILCSGLS